MAKNKKIDKVKKKIMKLPTHIYNNIDSIVIGILIMVIWVDLWFIIEFYLDKLHKKFGMTINYIVLVLAAFLLYILGKDSFNWILDYGV